MANSTKSLKSPNGRIVELDALRGIAAISVMAFHFSMMNEKIGQFFSWGVTGVDLFFLISGFVIYMTLEKTKSLRDFVISRFSRLFPSYLVMLCITSLAIYFIDRNAMPSFKTWLLNLTMMQPVFNVKYIDDSYWTLTVELLFYMIMGVLLVKKGLYNIEFTGAVILFTFLLYYLITAYFFPDSKLYIIPRSYLPIVSHFQLFFAGILFYKIKTKGNSLVRHILIIISFLITLYLFDKSGRAHFTMTFRDYTVMLTLYFIIFYLFNNGHLRFLNTGILVFLGEISYCIYLLHQKAGMLAYQFCRETLLWKPLITISSVAVMVIIVSASVTFGIERPAIRFIRRTFLK